MSYKFCWIGSGASAILSDIVLPNDTAWRFAYTGYSDQWISGNELTEITLPTGGTIAYGYQTIVPGGCGTTHPSAFRGVTSRTVDDRSGSGGQAWTYSWINGNTRALTITDPMNNVSVHTSSNLAYTSNPYTCNWKETKVQEYSGHSTLLKTTNELLQYRTRFNTADSDNRDMGQRADLSQHHQLRSASFLLLVFQQERRPDRPDAQRISNRQSVSGGRLRLHSSSITYHHDR